MIARDGGCSFPGCDRAPELCERHHIVAWLDGGRTDLHNLTLLCRYHHHQFTGGGWTATINTDGLPEWTPPAWIDLQRLRVSGVVFDPGLTLVTTGLLECLRIDLSVRVGGDADTAAWRAVTS